MEPWWRTWRGAVVAGVVCLGVVAAVLAIPPGVAGQPVAERYGLGVTRLDSADLDVRLHGIEELAMWGYDSPRQPDVMRTLSAFVRAHAPAGCVEPAKDVALAMTVLGRRDVTKDEDTVMDLHRACLAHIALANQDFERANLAGADLSGASLVRDRFDGASLGGTRLAGADLRQAQLVVVDLTSADLTGADLSGVRWSDGTQWPSEYEERIAAASTGATAEHVIGELRLP